MVVVVVVAAAAAGGTVVISRSSRHRRSRHVEDMGDLGRRARNFQNVACRL